jgi:hypothetical protein
MSDITRWLDLFASGVSRLITRAEPSRDRAEEKGKTRLLPCASWAGL